MKKNVLMRIASGTLVITMLTTCVISGTFAKYITDDSAHDKARVAKWGITLAVGGSLYGTTYYDGSQGAEDVNQVTAEVAEAKISVYGKQMDTEDPYVDTDYETNRVVAPGTESDDVGFYINLNGTPEVDANLDATIETQNIFLTKATYAVMVPIKKGSVTPENFDAICQQSENGAIYTREDGDGLIKNTNDSKTGHTYTKVAYVTENDQTTQYYTVEDLLDSDDWEVDGDADANYYPVVYTLHGDTESIGTVAVDTLSKLANEMAEKLKVSKGTDTIDGTNAKTNPDVTNNMVTTYKVTGTHIEQNTDYTNHFKLGGENITWVWDFEDTYDKHDTILGQLIAERVNVNGDAHSKDFLGDVVVLGDVDETDVSQPTEYEDYCLDTRFNIKIEIEQKD